MNDRQSHLDQIERWAMFVREHPMEWKKIHTEFIDAIFDKEQAFRERLLKMPGGKEKLEELRKLRLSR